MFFKKIKNYLFLFCLIQCNLINSFDFRFIENKININNNLVKVLILGITSGLIFYKYKNNKCTNLKSIDIEEKSNFQEKLTKVETITENKNRYLITVELTSLNNNSLHELKAKLI